MNLIAKEYSTPKKPEVWAKFKSFSGILFLLAIAGNIISARTEYAASESAAQGILMIIFLEGGAWVAAGMLFGNFFNLFRTKYKDTASWFFVVIGLVLLFNIVGTSLSMSEIGKDKQITEKEEVPPFVLIDSTEHKTMKDKALQVFNADSFNIVANLESEKIKEKDLLKKSISNLLSKRANIMKYQDYDYNKYKKSIIKIDQKVKANRTVLKNLNRTYEAKKNAELASAISKYNQGLAGASSMLLSSVSQADSLNNAAKMAYFSAIKRKKELFKYIIWMGVCFTMLYEFMYHLFRYLAKSEPKYTDPLDGLMTPFEKAKYAVSFWIWKYMDSLSNHILPSSEIELGNKSMKFNRTDLKKLIEIGVKNHAPTLAGGQDLFVTNHETYGTIANNIDIQNPVIQSNTNNKEPENTTIATLKTALDIDETGALLEREPIGFKLKTKPKTIVDVNHQITNATDKNSVIQSNTKEEQPEMNRVEVNKEDLESLNTGFNYTRYFQQLSKNFDRMIQTKAGSKRKTPDWKDVALNRAEKIATLVQIFVEKGYRVDIKNGLDGSFLDIDEPETKSLGHLPTVERKVVVYAAPNDYKLPIWISYPNLAAAPNYKK